MLFLRNWTKNGPQKCQICTHDGPKIANRALKTGTKMGYEKSDQNVPKSDQKVTKMLGFFGFFDLKWTKIGKKGSKTRPQKGPKTGNYRQKNTVWRPKNGLFDKFTFHQISQKYQKTHQKHEKR